MNEKDIDEFRRAMQGTTPLQTDPRVPETRPKPKPTAKFTKADEERVLAESLEDDIDTIEQASISFIKLFILVMFVLITLSVT